MKQPELTNVWGVSFYGKAETVSGGIWWYTNDDGVRYPLKPSNVQLMPAESET